MVSNNADRTGNTTARSGTQRRNQTGSQARRAGSHRMGSSPRGGKGNPRGTRKVSRGRRIARFVLFAFLAIIALAVTALGVAFATIQIPTPESIALSQATSVYYNDGKTKIGSFKRENREIISCKALPDYVGNAVVASENRTFWTDSGIDLKGIARAFINNVTTGSRQGGSTITQQYAERYYLGETKSYAGKLKEALLAVKIASTQDKDTVLCGYMNTIYFGRGAYGIQAAARVYFNKDAKDLSVSQAALLAGIIPAPSAWDPAVDATSAQKRFDRVIKIMTEDNYLTNEQKNQAEFPKTIKYNPSDDFAGSKGYLLTMVKDELVKTGKFTEDDIMTGGYKIITTISQTNQKQMQQTVAQSGAPSSLSTGAMSANVDNGEILAVYAGEDYISKPLNNATQASYQPGSTMKAFTLIGAIQSGTSLQTYFNGSSPRSFTGLSKTVSNFANESYGNINLITATAHSVNTVYVDLNQHVTPQKTAKIAQEAGISSSLQTDSLYNTLGIDGVHVSEITQAYQTIANDGERINLHIVRTVLPSDSKNALYTASTAGKRIFTASDTAIATTALRAVVTRGTGTLVMNTGKTIAGKSGTANDDTAVSFVGFSRHVVTTFANWSSAKDGSAQELPSFNGYTKSYGFSTYLFTQYMTAALANTADEAFPTATDTGKIGGQDGTWGLGGMTSYQYYGRRSSTDTNKKSTEDSTKTDTSQDKKSDDTDSKQQEKVEKKPATQQQAPDSSTQNNSSTTQNNNESHNNTDNKNNSDTSNNDGNTDQNSRSSENNSTNQGSQSDGNTNKNNNNQGNQNKKNNRDSQNNN